jgi:hypothetical protein
MLELSVPVDTAAEVPFDLLVHVGGRAPDEPLDDVGFRQWPPDLVTQVPDLLLERLRGIRVDHVVDDDGSPLSGQRQDDGPFRCRCFRQ